MKFVFAISTLLITQLSFADSYLDYLETLTYDQLILEALENANSLSEGGGWTGTGGNFHLHESNIWFLGNSDIPYCISRTSDYPLDDSKLDTLIKDSLSNWKRFFDKYGMLNKNINVTNQLGSVQFKDLANRAINFNFKKVTCTTNAKGEVEEIPNGLVFLFGVKNATIIKNQTTDETQLGVALRRPYNHKSYLSTGYIWLKDFSPEVNKIKHLLLHEIGHILGMKHDSVFVMDEDVAYQLRDNQKFNSDYFGRIESPAWMYRLQEGKIYNLTATRGRVLPNKCFNSDYTPNKFLPDYIKKLFNLKKAGCHKLVLSYVKNSQNAAQKLFKLQMFNLQGNVSREFRGALDASLIKPRENPSPGVFSEWKVKKSGQSRFLNQWFRMILDEKALMDLPVRGQMKVFTSTMRRGQKVPSVGVKITNRKGVLMEIYVPGINKWWVVKNIHNRFEN